MKKFFALVLAVVMAMSMASVAFAADAAVELGLAEVGYRYDSDADALKGNLGYGDVVLFQLFDENGDAISEYKFVEKLKVKVKYEMGEDVVSGVSIVKKYIDGEGYVYFLAFATKGNTTTADADVIGTVTLNRKADSKEGVAKVDDQEINFAFNIFHRNTYLSDSAKYKVVGESDVELKWDTVYLLKFDYDDEVDFTFGKDDMNEGTFTVDVSGQGKLYMKWNTKANEAIVAANPGVKMNFVNFNGAKFNRTGEFAYEMEDGVACYKVVGDKLVAIPGAEYDEADEAFYFNTRVLENYVFASAELVNPVVEAPVVEAAPVAPSNPSTGA
jgi:hypothetical protein